MSVQSSANSDFIYIYIYILTFNVFDLSTFYNCFRCIHLKKGLEEYKAELLPRTLYDLQLSLVMMIHEDSSRFQS